MVVIGVLYLVFEDKAIADFSGAKSKPLYKKNHISTVLIGIQVSMNSYSQGSLLNKNQTSLILLATIVTRSSALSLQAKAGLPRGNQVVGWLILIVSLLMPLAHRLQPNSHYLHRLMVIFLTFAPTFVILTISYEGIFYVVYCITLLTWVRLEHYSQIFTDPPTNKLPGANGSITAASRVPSRVPQFRPLRLSDARVALFFFVLLQSAFFSTGKIASISSFSLESVCRFLPVFNPFSQTALLIFTIMIPFTLVSAYLGILNKLLGVAPSALFMVAIGMSDVLTLHFWVVKDEGSWLEIGSTICHFVVASLFCMFIAGLEGVSAMLISGIEVERGSDEKSPAQVNRAAMYTVADLQNNKEKLSING